MFLYIIYVLYTRRCACSWILLLPFSGELRLTRDLNDLYVLPNKPWLSSLFISKHLKSSKLITVTCAEGTEGATQLNQPS